MNNFYEDLKKYFETTPREKVLEDWAKSKEFNTVGITMDEFLNNNKMIGKFVIVKDLETGEYMKDENGVCLYDSPKEALEVCGIYEFPHAVVLEVKAEYEDK
jgi:hypothetical protein